MARKKIKKSHMSDNAFAELMESAEQALAYERGAREGFRVTRIVAPRPPRPMSSEEIAQLRKRLRYSQSVFAQALNVNIKTVQAWEQGASERTKRRRPQTTEHREETSRDLGGGLSSSRPSSANFFSP